MGRTWIRRRFLKMSNVLHLSAKALTNALTEYPVRRQLRTGHFLALRAAAAVSIAVKRCALNTGSFGASVK
jgi:hypothetical protein